MDPQHGPPTGTFASQNKVAVRQERRGLRLRHLLCGEEVHAADLAGPVDDEQCAVASGQEPQVAGLGMHGCFGEEQTHGRLLLAAPREPRRHGDALLRGSGLPRALLRAAGGLDGRLPRRFHWYIAETTARLGQVNRLIAGDAPVWHAEPGKPGMDHGPARAPAPVARKSPLPQDFF